MNYPQQAADIKKQSVVKAFYRAKTPRAQVIG
jgi:hypothetical protein